MEKELNLKEFNFTDRVNLDQEQGTESLSLNSCVNTDESKPNNFFHMNSLSSNRSLSITSSTQNYSQTNLLASGQRADMNKSRFCKNSPFQRQGPAEEHHFRKTRQTGHVSDQSNNVPSTHLSTNKPIPSHKSNDIQFTIYSVSPDISAHDKKRKAFFNDKNGRKNRYEEQSGSEGESRLQSRLSHGSSQTNGFFKNQTKEHFSSRDSQVFFETFNKQQTDRTKFVTSEFNHKPDAEAFGLGKEKAFRKVERPEVERLERGNLELIDFRLSREASARNPFQSQKRRRKPSQEVEGSLLQNCEKMSYSYSTLHDNFNRSNSHSKALSAFHDKMSKEGESESHIEKESDLMDMTEIQEEPHSPLLKPSWGRADYENVPKQLVALSPSLIQKKPRTEARPEKPGQAESNQTLIYEDLPEFDSPNCKLKSNMINKESPQSGSPCKKSHVSKFKSNLNSSKKSVKSRRSKPRQFQLDNDKENKNLDSHDGQFNSNKIPSRSKNYIQDKVQQSPNINHYFNNLRRSMTEYHGKKYNANISENYFRKKSKTRRNEEIMNNSSSITKVQANPYKLNLKEIVKQNDRVSKPQVKKLKYPSQDPSSQTNQMKTIEILSETDHLSKKEADRARKLSNQASIFESSETKNFRRSERKSSKYRYRPSQKSGMFQDSALSSDFRRNPGSKFKNEGWRDSLNPSNKYFNRKSHKDHSSSINRFSVSKLKDHSLRKINSKSKQKLFTKKENKKEIMNFEIINTTQSKFEQKNLIRNCIEKEKDPNNYPITSQFNSKNVRKQVNKQIQLSKQNFSQKELFSNLKSFNNILAKDKQIIGTENFFF